MTIKRLMMAGLLGGLALGTAACTDGYGYGGVATDWGGGDPYYADGYGYAPSYYGWYGDYYYPGTGGYVYDRNRRAHRWSGDQQRYWQQRRYGWNDRDVRSNWRDFGRDVRGERREYRGEVRDNRQALRAGTITRDQFRQQQRAARQDYRQDVRREYRELRRENRAEGYRTPRPNRAFRPRRD